MIKGVTATPVSLPALRVPYPVHIGPLETSKVPPCPKNIHSQVLLIQWHVAASTAPVHYKASPHWRYAVLLCSLVISLHQMEASLQMKPTCGGFLTFPKEPWPRTLRSSNCVGSAFSQPSFTWWVMGISL